MAARLTQHAAMRLAQRAISNDDVELVELIGTEVEGGYLVLEKDYQSLERDLKRIREHARRLVGKRVVIDGDRILTAYHANRGKERRLLRSAQVRSLME